MVPVIRRQGGPGNSETRLFKSPIPISSPALENKTMPVLTEVLSIKSVPKGPYENTQAIVSNGKEHDSFCWNVNADVKDDVMAPILAGMETLPGLKRGLCYNHPLP